MATGSHYRTTAHPSAATSNGQGTPAAGAVAPPARGVRLPELVVGVLVMVVCALGAVLWHLSAVERAPVLAVAATVERGHTLTAADIEVVYVSTDDALSTLDQSQHGEVVGRVALVDISAGTLLTNDLVADQPALDTGDGIVGLALDPGGFPALGLSPGDSVDVVISADPEVVAAEGSAPDTAVPASGLNGSVIAAGASVVAVEELPSERRLVTIQTSQADARAVAAAAGSGALRLVQVAP